MHATCGQRQLSVLRCLRQQALRHTTRSAIGQRRYDSSIDSKARIPDFAFAFDIDGVLVRSSKPLPGAAKSLSNLQRQKIPFILLTNGGGMHETERIGQLNHKLDVALDSDVIIQSHTPFAEMVQGRAGQDALEDKCVLVVGGPADKCRHVARRYGFKSVVTPADIFTRHRSIWPFSAPFADYYEQFSEPLKKPIDVQDPSKSLKIDAILVFNDPRDWALDIQIILDVLLSREGILGTYSEKNNQANLPNRGFQQDGQPKLYLSNPDLLWAAAYHQPRLGQGGFCAALEGVWNAMTGGPQAGVRLQKTIIGKPHFETYEFAEKRLLQQRANFFGDGIQPPLRNVYMIGDNPESDIRGANSYSSHSGISWTSVLVRSGVYAGGEPTYPPHTVVDGVEQAVEWCLKRSEWRGFVY